MANKAPLVIGGLLLGGSVIGGIAYALTRKEEEEEGPKAEFRGLQAAYEGTPSSPVIEKFVYDVWGADLTFEHRGVGGTFVVGIAFAYDVAFGHSAPFYGTAKEITLPDEVDWTPYTVELRGVVQDWITTGKLIDVIRYISDTWREPNKLPTNPYGVNDWKDNVYAVIGASTFGALSAVYL